MKARSILDLPLNKFIFYRNASILFEKKAVGHVTWSKDLVQQSLLRRGLRQVLQSLPTWPAYYLQIGLNAREVTEQTPTHHTNKHQRAKLCQAQPTDYKSFGLDAVPFPAFGRPCAKKTMEALKLVQPFGRPKLCLP